MGDTFPIKILDGESQLDRIEKKLDAIIQKLEIEVEDTSREAVANRAELEDFHTALCRRNEFCVVVRDYLAKRAQDHDRILVKVLEPWSFDINSSDLKEVTNKISLSTDETGDHFAIYLTYQFGMPKQITVSRLPLVSSYPSVTANIYQCNFITSFANAVIDHKIEVSDLGDYDISKYRSISEDFDEWWNGLCQVGDSIEGVIHVLKDICISIEGENGTSCFEADPNFPRGIKITRHDDDTADFELAAFSSKVTANFNLLGRFLYHCIILGEIEIPGFKNWRIHKYTGVWPESSQVEETNGR